MEHKERKIQFIAGTSRHAPRLLRRRRHRRHLCGRRYRLVFCVDVVIALVFYKHIIVVDVIIVLIFYFNVVVILVSYVDVVLVPSSIRTMVSDYGDGVRVE